MTDSVGLQIQVDTLISNLKCLGVNPPPPLVDFDSLWLGYCIMDNYVFMLKSNLYIQCTKQNKKYLENIAYECQVFRV